MKKLLAVMLFVMFLMPVAAGQVLAAEETSKAAIVDAGNKLCPISGEPVSGKDFTVYNGKRYGFCCAGCDKKFLSDPEKYIAQMEAKEKASVSEMTPDEAKSKQMEKDMEQGSL